MKGLGPTQRPENTHIALTDNEVASISILWKGRWRDLRSHVGLVLLGHSTPTRKPDESLS